MEKVLSRVQLHPSGHVGQYIRRIEYQARRALRHIASARRGKSTLKLRSRRTSLNGVNKDSSRNQWGQTHRKDRAYRRYSHLRSIA